MKAEVVDLGPCKKRLQVEIEVEKVREEYESIYRDLTKEAKIDGFRVGRIPRPLVERRFGRDIARDTKGRLLARSFEEAVKEKGLRPVGEPDLDLEAIELDREKPFTYDVTVEVKPNFDLPGYKGLTLEAPRVEPTDDDVKEALTGVRRRAADLEPVASAAKTGDYLVVDARVAGEDGAELWKEEEMMVLLGEKEVQGLPFTLGAESLAKKAGAEVTESVELGARFPVEAARGKKAEAIIKIHDVKRPKLPPLDEDFAKKMGFESIEKMLEHTRAQITTERERGAQYQLRLKAVDALIAGAGFPLPEKLLEDQAQRIAMRNKLRLAQFGLPRDEIDKRGEEIEKQSKEQAEREIRQFLLLERIAEEEKVEVAPAELEQEIHRAAASANKTPAQVRGELESEGTLGLLEVDLREQKVLDFIISNADIKRTDSAPAEAGAASDKAKAAKGKKKSARKPAAKKPKAKARKKPEKK